MSTVPLPPVLALKSLHFGLYLTHTDGYVRVDGSNVFSPSAKFEVLLANTGTGAHLRCWKNRKYLRRQTGTDVITPDAAEPEEDPSNWGCTLFEPRVVEAGNTARTYLFHVQSQSYATAVDVTSGVRSLILNYTTPIQPSIFDFIDLESVFVLPKYVAFKADNGKYLRVRDGRDRWWLSQFTSNEKGYSQCRYETTTNGHGEVYLKSIHHNKYLACEGGPGRYINANFDEPSKYGFFWPMKVDANTVALKNTHYQKFAKRFTNALHDLFSTISTSRDSCAELKVEEHVLNRRIYNTVFDLKNARIYDETPKVMATQRATNDTSTTNTAELKFIYQDSKSTTWTSGYSWTVGISVSANFKVPFIGETGVTANTEYSNSYEMGETITTTKTLESSYTVTVPPYSTIAVNLMATEGKYDVTYSYYQRDQLWDGNYETYIKDDGVCKGMNSYNFHFVASPEVSNLEPRAYLSDSSVVHPKRVEIIPLPELSDPTRVQHPVSTTATTTTEQDLETPQLTEWIVAAPPPETNEEGAEIVA